MVFVFSLFRPKLKEHMQYCVDHPEEISNLSKIKTQVNEVKGVMLENIDRVLDRGEKIEIIVEKTNDLHSQVMKTFISSNSFLMILNFINNEMCNA